MRWPLHYQILAATVLGTVIGLAFNPGALALPDAKFERTTPGSIVESGSVFSKWRSHQIRNSRRPGQDRCRIARCVFVLRKTEFMPSILGCTNKKSGPFPWFRDWRWDPPTILLRATPGSNRHFSVIGKVPDGGWMLFRDGLEGFFCGC